MNMALFTIVSHNEVFAKKRVCIGMTVGARDGCRVPVLVCVKGALKRIQERPPFPNFGKDGEPRNSMAVAAPVERLAIGLVVLKNLFRRRVRSR